MAAQLTDKQRKQIVADRAEGMTIRQIARKYKTSSTTVQRIVTKDTTTAQKITEKKRQNTRDVLEYLDSRKDKLQDVLDLGFEALSNPEKYERASLQSVATMMGILIDKYTDLAQLNRASGQGNELLQSLLDLEKGRSNNGD